MMNRLTFRFRLLLDCLYTYPKIDSISTEFVGGGSQPLEIVKGGSKRKDLGNSGTTKILDSARGSVYFRGIVEKLEPKRKTPTGKIRIIKVSRFPLM